MNPETGQKKWEFRVGSAVVASPEILKDGVLFATRSGRVYKIDRITGKEIATRDFGANIIGSPLSYNDTSIFIAAGNTLYDVDPQSTN